MKIYLDRIEICCDKPKIKGGHWHWFCESTGFHYLIINWWSRPKFWIIRAVSVYYDGWHNNIEIGPFGISWGGPQSFKEV